MTTIFFEISAIVIVSAGLALLAKILKQPIVLAFMLTGVLLGPLGFNVLQSTQLIEVLGSFGIALMLYLVGIELDIKKLYRLQSTVLYAGFGQVIGCGLVGFLVAWLLGFSTVESWFISIALAFSSTIIVVKLLGEKQQLDSLYGRITVAILLIQDFLAVLALLVVEAFATRSITSIPWLELGLTFGKAILIAALAIILAKYVFRKLFMLIGRSQELLFLWSLAWCLAFAALAEALHFSIAIAVFFAGIAIAQLDYNYEIAARIRSLRDFFIVIFFSLLGSELIFTLDYRLLYGTIFLSIFVLFGTPLIVYTILVLCGQQNRVALFVGLAVAQISEFSFILAKRGAEVGFIQQDVVSMIALVGLITMVISTYGITYNESIYRWLKPLLHRFHPITRTDQMDCLPKKLKHHVIVFGYHVTVNKVLRELKRLYTNVVIVDYDPNNRESIAAQGVYTLYGDMRDEEILDQAGVRDADLLLSIVPYQIPTLTLLQYCRHFKVAAHIIVSASHLADVDSFYKLDASFVLHPESISLDYLKHILTNKQLTKASKLHKKELVTLLESTL